MHSIAGCTLLPLAVEQEIEVGAEQQLQPPNTQSSRVALVAVVEDQGVKAAAVVCSWVAERTDFYSLCITARRKRREHRSEGSSFQHTGPDQFETNELTKIIGL